MSMNADRRRIYVIQNFYRNLSDDVIPSSIHNLLRVPTLLLDAWIYQFGTLEKSLEARGSHEKETINRTGAT